ncbi:DUF2905 domain-containing protein [Methylomagnum sp.]
MPVGKALIYLGMAACGVGLILTYAPGLLGWFGKLPGDIRIEDENRSIFIPITSMAVVSLVLSLLINWFSRR